MNSFHFMMAISIALMGVCETSSILDYKQIKSFTKSFFSYSRKLGQILRIKESCRPEWVNSDKSGLEQFIKNELIGQEIAQLEIPQIIGNHWEKNIGSKNLLLCFFGSPGTGKSFTTKLISQYMFKKGDKSYYYQLYSGSDPALYSGHINEYKSDIIESIEEAVNDCPYSVIVFDEADKYPYGFLDSVIIPFIEGNNDRKHPLGKSTFIFLTNTGESDVIDKTLEIKRSYFSSNTLSNFASIKDKITSEGKDSFSTSTLVQKGHVEHFIPFLPLTPESYMKCVEKVLPTFGEFYTKNAVKNILTRNILQKMKLIPEAYPSFINTGCKRVMPAIALEISLMKDNKFIPDEL